MISPQSYTKEWILSQVKTIGKADPNLLEMVIYAFSLLEQLVAGKLEFVFKGGTSLLLLLPEQKRFSTDIDILSTAERKDIEVLLEQICKTSVFSRWELDDRRSYKPGIPKAHYKLFFTSGLDDKEKHIMLDIVFENPSYPEMLTKQISLPWFQIDGDPLIVSVPSPNAILGDKLCAFAPNTIGVPYNADKDREIVKQLFDINLLMPYVTDINLVSRSFTNTAAQEISYRPDKPFKMDEIYSDVRQTAFMMAHGFRERYASATNRENYIAIENGRAALRSFMIGRAMLPKESILLAASQAAYTTTLIQTGRTDSFQLFDEKMDLSAFQFTELDYSPLNRLSKLPGGILYYLKNVYDLTR
jgi:hypothetical protein